MSAYRASTIVMAACLVMGCSTQFKTDGGGEDAVPDTQLDTHVDVPADAPADVPVDTPVDGGAECGDGEVEGDEECDDGNDVGGDGCENDCRWTCHSASECDDMEQCNGTEICNEDHVCEAGSALDDGTLVDVGPPRMICLEGATVESVCGDGFVDTGGGEFCDPPGSGGCEAGCVFGCEDDDDCTDDGNFCNGVEYCDTSAHVCARRDVPTSGTDCDDSNPCTSIDECDGSGTCVGSGNSCDDGHSCTDDACDSTTGGCTITVHAGYCLIADACYSHATENPGNECEECNSSLSTMSWSRKADHTACSDEGLSCTVDECRAGSCVHLVASSRCLIGGTCRTDGDANPSNECEECRNSVSESSWSAVADGTGCTDEGVSCTVDECQSGSCTHDVGTGYCYIGGICYSAGFSNPSNFCQSCDTSAPLVWTPRTGSACDDGEFCTTSDMCTSSSTCVGTAESYLFDAVQVSGGYVFSCARLSTGRIRCWGYGSGGRLGYGSMTNRYRPVEVTGITAASFLNSGQNHSCAVDGGAAKCWGVNADSQLGNGTSTDSSVPVQVSGLTSGVSQVCAGQTHSCALLTGGTMRCWGRGTSGELGTGGYTNSSVPVVVLNQDGTGTLTGIVDIACGNAHTCAVNSSGAAYCWGSSTYGKLGNGTSSGFFPRPVAVCSEWGGCMGGYLVGVDEIESANLHTCARKGSAVFCWGYNVGGQIGNGNIGTQATNPQAVINDDMSLVADAAQLSVGGHFNCVTTRSDEIKCWGRNNQCQVGDLSSIDKSRAVYVLTSTGSIFTGATYVGTAYEHSCAVANTADNVVCWGDNPVGNLGDGTTGDRCYPDLASCSY
ncbi:MAG: hypothetical protein JRG91_12945 [Deltaproteobacteria bacterium]|nr:hypothetical protein [Deltaproteobacteria bacterium]